MKVTVYIPTRNRCALLRRAVNSVLRQTYDDIDLIVVDDGSTDDTRKYLSDLECSGVLRLITNRNGYGACHARNEAIEAAIGNFVTGLDDDDFFMPERLHYFVKNWTKVALSNENTMAGLFDSVVLKGRNQERLLYEKSAVSRHDLRRANFIGNQVFAPREHYIRAGFFDPQLPAWQDWDLWLRMADMHGDFFNIKKGTYVINASRSHAPEAISAKPEFMMRYASQLFAHKHQLISLRERSTVTVNLLKYRQIRPSLKDIVILLYGGYVREALRMGLKKSRLKPSLRGLRRLFQRNDVPPEPALLPGEPALLPGPSANLETE